MNAYKHIIRMAIFYIHNLPNTQFNNYLTNY